MGEELTAEELERLEQIANDPTETHQEVMQLGRDFILYNDTRSDDMLLSISDLDGFTFTFDPDTALKLSTHLAEWAKRQNAWGVKERVKLVGRLRLYGWSNQRILDEAELGHETIHDVVADVRSFIGDNTKEQGNG